MLIQIFNGHILTPEGWINDGSVIFDKGHIVEIRNSSKLVDKAKKVDARGMHVVPGGIEMHVHGGGGRDFMEGTPEAFRTAATAHLKHGTTAIFPTLSSSTMPIIDKGCETCSQLMKEPNTTIMGLHLEGPYFNRAKAGAQMPDIIRPANPDEYHHVVEDYDCLRRWDASPEVEGTIELGRYLSNKGIVASIAHTAAEYKEVKAAWDAGYTHATHLYNQMPGFHNVREFKHEGTVECVYIIDEMTVEVISDGIHVPPVLLKLAYKIKGADRTALTTDALAVAASDSKTAFDPRVIIEDGVCKLADRSALAGSIATTDRIIKTAVEKAGIPLFDAVRMASETPAHIMGIYDRKGSLQRGKDADILIMDNDLNLRSVYSMGELVEGTNTL